MLFGDRRKTLLTLQLKQKLHRAIFWTRFENKTPGDAQKCWHLLSLWIVNELCIFCIVIEKENLKFKYLLLKNKQEKGWSRENENQVEISFWLFSFVFFFFFSYKVKGRSAHIAVQTVITKTQFIQAEVTMWVVSLELFNAVAPSLGQGLGESLQRKRQAGDRCLVTLNLPEWQLVSGSC